MWPTKIYLNEMPINNLIIILKNIKNDANSIHQTEKHEIVKYHTHYSYLIKCENGCKCKYTNCLYEWFCEDLSRLIFEYIPDITITYNITSLETNTISISPIYGKTMTIGIDNISRLRLFAHIFFGLRSHRSIPIRQIDDLVIDNLMQSIKISIDINVYDKLNGIEALLFILHFLSAIIAGDCIMQDIELPLVSATYAMYGACRGLLYMLQINNNIIWSLTDSMIAIYYMNVSLAILMYFLCIPLYLFKKKFIL